MAYAQKISKAKEKKKWYFGTRLNKWYHLEPSKVSEYKRNEGFSDEEFKKLGKKKAREIATSPSLI